MSNPHPDPLIRFLAQGWYKDFHGNSHPPPRINVSGMPGQRTGDNIKAGALVATYLVYTAQARSRARSSTKGKRRSDHGALRDACAITADQLGEVLFGRMMMRDSIIQQLYRYVVKHEEAVEKAYRDQPLPNRITSSAMSDAVGGVPDPFGVGRYGNHGAAITSLKSAQRSK